MVAESAVASGASAPAPDNHRAEEDDAQREEDEFDAACEENDLADNKSKKKRKLVKNSEKKYQCPHGDCGKAYSRAEHLYRHQLNHRPKQIYRCDAPGCDRHFVRADLCARHKERHSAKGSHLQRKDAFLYSQHPLPTASSTTPPSVSSAGAAASASPTLVSRDMPQQSNYSDAQMSAGAPVQPYAPGDQYRSGVASRVTQDRISFRITGEQQLPSNDFAASTKSGPPPLFMGVPPSRDSMRRYTSEDGHIRSSSQDHGPPSFYPGSANVMHPPSTTTPQGPSGGFGNQPYPSPSTASQQFRSPTQYSMLPSLPPFGYPPPLGAPSGVRSGNLMSPPNASSSDQLSLPNSRCNSFPDFNVIDQMTAGYAMPVFGNESFNRSPPSIMDESFINSLFNVTGLDLGANPSPPGLEPMHNPQVFSAQLPKLEPDGTPHYQTKPADLWSTPALTVIDINIRESSIGENKRLRLTDMVSSWPEIEHNPGRRTKGDILMGDTTNVHHVLSLHMLKTYITSYWLHIHQQMPILHRPTFNAETCPDLMLLAIMCLGATCLERTSPVELTKNSAELAFFMAHHIRWEVFKDAEFRPTAKLWTFQTMLLLELFEKMYSTRALHERAHIHHATTLTVMRRGSSLIGRSSTDSLHDSNDPTRTPPGPDGSINTSGQNTPDAFWNRWITAEATRRVAFAAFVIDSTHATLFGHSAVMSPHDLKLPLPCDEALWSATSSAEVQRVEASLAANGFKPTSFLDGIKRTLNGQKVRTNTFGRVIIMSALLNISWHLNQRDLQVSSLGVQNTLGNQIKWRGSLNRAFDFWRRDFDESLSKNEQWLQVCNPKATDRTSVDQRDNVFESRTCLHSLAHMAMHVDMVDCEVFAGSVRVLGRVVTDTDRAAVQKRMREQWAPSARARDATFYALRFLCEVLMPDDELGPQTAARRTFTYNARDDYLLNRPWILFFAALTVWSYGYALDGPLRPSNYTLTNRELQIHDMQRYLVRMGGVASPDDMEKLKDRNSCLGLLLLLRECFRQPSWELLHEAGDVLGSCINLLAPGHTEIPAKQ